MLEMSFIIGKGKFQMFKLVYKSNINCSARFYSNNLLPRGLYAGLGNLREKVSFLVKSHCGPFLALYTMRI